MPLTYTTAALMAIHAREEAQAEELAEATEVADYLRIHGTGEPEPDRKEGE